MAKVLKQNGGEPYFEGLSALDLPPASTPPNNYFVHSSYNNVSPYFSSLDNCLTNTTGGVIHVYDNQSCTARINNRILFANYNEITFNYTIESSYVYDCIIQIPTSQGLYAQFASFINCEGSTSILSVFQVGVGVVIDSPNLNIGKLRNISGAANIKVRDIVYYESDSEKTFLTANKISSIRLESTAVNEIHCTEAVNVNNYGKLTLYTSLININTSSIYCRADSVTEVYNAKIFASTNVAFSCYNGSFLTLNNVKIKGSNNAFAVNGISGGTVTLNANNCIFDAKNAAGASVQYINNGLWNGVVASGSVTATYSSTNALNANVANLFDTIKSF